MAHFAKVIATIERSTGLPADAIVNVMHFDADDSVGSFDQTLAEALAGRVIDFYQLNQSRIPQGLVTGDINVKVYNMKDAEPRVPVASVDDTFLPSGGEGLPAEVALCISFQASPESGTNQARRRGRIYFGPCAMVMADELSGDSRPTAAAIASIGGDFAAMVIGPGAGDFRLAVYSPTTFASLDPLLPLDQRLDASFVDVEEVWIDNAWDTHRSRGAVATTRTTFVPS